MRSHLWPKTFTVTFFLSFLGLVLGFCWQQTEMVKLFMSEYLLPSKGTSHLISIYYVSKDSISHWLHYLALSCFYWHLLVVHINEIQCDISAHAYGMYWSNQGHKHPFFLSPLYVWRFWVSPDLSEIYNRLSELSSSCCSMEPQHSLLLPNSIILNFYLPFPEENNRNSKKPHHGLSHKIYPQGLLTIKPGKL